jgi:hypothetical protein
VARSICQVFPGDLFKKKKSEGNTIQLKTFHENNLHKKLHKTNSQDSIVAQMCTINV